MKLLTLTTLFPNSVIPRHGVFVENRLRHLLDSGEVTTKVIAPVPWFPFKSSLFGEYGGYAKVPKTERRHDVDILHPRFMLIPKIGMTLTPSFLASTMLKSAKQLIKNGYDFDIIDAHYFYPDGVAAVQVAKQLNKPVVITARGTDLNLIPQYQKPRQMIKSAARDANAMITVCQALKDVLITMGVPDDKVTVLRNGVDLDMFTPPDDRESLKQKLGLQGKTLLSVGHLIKRKGHDLVIKSLKKIPNTKLLIAGDGVELSSLTSLVKTEQLEDRVTFLGAISHTELKEYYGAADALVLASDREGWANVLLESMACGTPVVATNIWGTPEVVAAPEAGLLTDRDPEAIANTVNQLFLNYPDRVKTRVYAEKFSWDATTQGQLDLFRQIL